MPDNDNKRQKELDEFWDVESLLPDKRSRTPIRRPAAAPTPVEVELTPHRDDTPRDAVGSVPLTVKREDYPSSFRPRPNPQPRPETAPPTVPNPLNRQAPGHITAPDGDAPLDVERGTPHFVPPHTAAEGREDEPELVYVPDGVLLHKVTVYGWKSNYHYFDDFVRDAQRFSALKPTGREVRREPFFSFLPQYAQLNPGQRAWYVAWRESARHGKYPDTDYAYILLYLFELINLPASDDEAAAARDRMADVWMAYRRRYPQLDHYMCEWLCDYCLVHRLAAPVDRLVPALNEIIEMSRLKEFYLTSAVSGEGHDAESARILLRHCCQYDYHKSKFAQGEHAPLFDKLIPGAVTAMLPLLLGRNGQPPLVTMQDTSATRDVFTGALCAYRNKRRVVVSYTSFSRSHEFRFLIGDMVKHVENRIRGWIGVRSRLSVMTLPVPLRDAIDEWLRPFTPDRPAAPAPKEQPRPAYEALYDLPDKALSLSDADAIEQASWSTTRILTEAFGAGEDSPAEDDAVRVRPPIPETGTDIPADGISDGGSVPLTAATPVTPEAPVDPPAAGSESPGDNPLAAALGDLCGFVRLALDADGAGQRAFAVAHHTMPDALADEINGVTADSELGDVILEDRGDGTYTVIADYRDEVLAVLGL